MDLDGQQEQNSLNKSVPSREKKTVRDLMAITTETGLFGSLGVLSEFLKPLDRYAEVSRFIGNNLPLIIRNHGGDIAFVSVISSLCMAMFYARESAKTESSGKKGVRNGALFGMAVSIFYALEETSRIYQTLPLNSPSVRAFTSNVARGDWSDVLAYSVPFIAGSLYFAQDIARNALAKLPIRRSKESSQPVTNHLSKASN